MSPTSKPAYAPAPQASPSLAPALAAARAMPQVAPRSNLPRVAVSAKSFLVSRFIHSMDTITFFIINSCLFKFVNIYKKNYICMLCKVCFLLSGGLNKTRAVFRAFCQQYTPAVVPHPMLRPSATILPSPVMPQPSLVSVAPIRPAAGAAGVRAPTPRANRRNSKNNQQKDDVVDLTSDDDVAVVSSTPGQRKKGKKYNHFLSSKHSESARFSSGFRDNIVPSSKVE